LKNIYVSYFACQLDFHEHFKKRIAETIEKLFIVTYYIEL